MSLNQGGGFVKSDHRQQVPALQLYFSPLSYSTAPRGKRPLMSPYPYSAVRLGFNLTKPTSTGKVSLQSADPYDQPKFLGNYITAHEDKKVMLAGMHLMRRFLQTDALQAIVNQELTPGARAQNDADLLNFSLNEGEQYSINAEPVEWAKMPLVLLWIKD